MSLREGFWVGFRGVVRGGFPVEKRGKRGRGWGGWGLGFSQKTGDQYHSWWTFRIFFFCSGRGNGESEAPGGGGSFFIENPREGVGERDGAEGPGGCLRRIGEFFGGGGAKFFFFGAETSTKHWTTGLPDNGHEWRKFRVVPRSYPWSTKLCLLRVEREGLLDFQGGQGSFPLYGGTFARSYLVIYSSIYDV